MSRRTMKTFIKKKAGQELGYRTPDFFKGSRFGSSKASAARLKFNPSQFRTQHKGG